MGIERIITFIVGNASRRSMHFQAGDTIDIPPNPRNRDLFLYVHIPFCETLCPYCSFNRYQLEEDLARRYFKALRRELVLYHARGYECSGVCLGGGTPTILMDELAETIMLIKELYAVREITVETNPNHLTDDRIEALREMGVNRLSVGVQSFDDTILQSMGRYDKYGSAREIIARLKQTQGCFDTMNIDMMFNFPKQNSAMLEKDIDILLDLGSDQVIFYPLMTTPATRDALSTDWGRVDRRQEKQFYYRILERMSTQFEPTTPWCFSRNRGMIDEYIVNYEEYLGLGSGSFGYLNGTMYANTFSLEEYVARLEADELPFAFKKEFSKAEQMRYSFLMQLFGGELEIESFRRRFSGDFFKYLWKEFLFFRLLGSIRKEKNQVSLTQRGMYHWLTAMKEFFAGVNSFRDHCRALINPG